MSKRFYSLRKDLNNVFNSMQKKLGVECSCLLAILSGSSMLFQYFPWVNATSVFC